MSKSRTELASVGPPIADVAREAGHQRQSPLLAIREKCIDCSGGSLLRRASARLLPARCGRSGQVSTRGWRNL